MRVIMILIIPVLLLGSCSTSGSKSGTKSKNTETTEVSIPAENLAHIHLEVKGMTCEGCENAVVAGINKLEGIQEATASHTDEEAVIVFDSSKTNQEEISEAIAEAGYSVKGEKAHSH